MVSLTDKDNVWYDIWMTERDNSGEIASTEGLATESD
jgi:hypothetical protein